MEVFRVFKCIFAMFTLYLLVSECKSIFPGSKASWPREFTGIT